MVVIDELKQEQLRCLYGKKSKMGIQTKKQSVRIQQSNISHTFKTKSLTLNE